MCDGDEVEDFVGFVAREMCGENYIVVFDRDSVTKVPDAICAWMFNPELDFDESDCIEMIVKFDEMVVAEGEEGIAD